MLKRLAILLLLALPLTLAIASCGDDTEVDTSGGDGSEGATLDLSARDFAFSPSTLSVEPGSEVTMTVTNDGNVQHTFTIDALSIDETIDPGEEVTLSFTSEGDERFYCRFHETAAMEGTISAGEEGASGDGTTPTEDPAGEFSY